MKYNIGDKVIDLTQLDNLDNTFWNKAQLSSCVYEIKAANDSLFSFYNEEIPSDIAGMYKYEYYRQDGTNLSYCANIKKVHHLEKDVKIINNIINIEVGKVLNKLNEENNKKIRKLEASINKLKNKDTSNYNAVKDSINILRERMPNLIISGEL